MTVIHRSPLKIPTQLDLVPLQSQVSQAEVLAHSHAELGLLKWREVHALECLRLLEAFSPNCGICCAESGGTTQTEVNHKTIKNCAPIGGYFSKFYDFNKPVSGLCIGWPSLTPQQTPDKWNYDVTVSNWCWACALPHSVLKAEGSNHSAQHCPWSDIMTGVAWSVWHNEETFKAMKSKVPCSIRSPEMVKSPVEFTMWLSGENEARTAWNIHDVWVWYATEVIGVVSRR